MAISTAASVGRAPVAGERHGHIQAAIAEKNHIKSIDRLPGAGQIAQYGEYQKNICSNSGMLRKVST